MSEVETVTGEMPVKKSKAEMLAEAKLEIRELAARIAEMEKQLKSVSDTKDYYSRLHSEAANKLEEMHILLMDSPGCVGRKTSDDYHGKEFSLAARFASWLAQRGGQS